MIYLLAFIIIYILSTWRAWWWIRMAHYHPNGKWSGSDPYPEHYLATFCPVANTVFCVSTVIISWQDKRNINNNIFKPKKPLI